MPGSLGWGFIVFARIAIFAPSYAARVAIASPIPLEAPVIRRVLPLRVVTAVSLGTCLKTVTHFFVSILCWRRSRFMRTDIMRLKGFSEGVVSNNLFITF